MIMLPNTATPFEVTVDVISDILTVIAYFSILLELLYFFKHYPTTIPKKYQFIIVIFALYIILCGLTHAFNAWRFSIGIMLCTKLSTAIISILIAAVLFVLIPDILQCVHYVTTLEEETMTETDTSDTPEVEEYIHRRRSSIQLDFSDVVNLVIANKNNRL